MSQKRAHVSVTLLRRDRRADAGAGVAHRSRERRCGRLGVVHVTGSRRRLSARHGADGIRARTAGRDLIRRTGVERAGAAQAGLCVRAGQAGPQGAPVPGDGGLTRVVTFGVPVGLRGGAFAETFRVTQSPPRRSGWRAGS